MSVKNLSEKLFRPKFNYPETSALIQRVDERTATQQSVLDGEVNSHWYRVINPLLWHLRGIPFMEIETVLARIAASDKRHTNDQWLDSVVGYQSGNWIFEHLSQANIWQRKAEAEASASDETDALCREAAYQSWLITSQLCSLASYPHYKNDDLASQAQVYAYRAYKEALSYSPYAHRELDFNVGGHVVKGMLHLPQARAERAVPVVIMCGGLTNLQIDFHRFFADFLAPKGLAMLTVDAQGVGNSRQFNLTQNSSEIYQAVLEQLSHLPWIDHHRVVLAGYRFGCHSAVRLSYLAPQRIKGVLCIAPLVHQLFVDKSLQATIPIMYKDLIACRLGLTSVSNQQLSAELNYFSLKNQGLINRPTSVNVMSLVFENDPISPLSEAKLIMSTKQHRIVNVAATPLQKNLEKALSTSTDWISQLLNA